MTDYANWSARDRSPTDGSPLERLREGPPVERCDAALALVDRADREGLTDRAVSTLADRVRNDDDPDVRQFAVEALGNAGRGGDAVEGAADDDDEWVRAEAVVARARIDGADAADAYRAALDDESGWVRRNAVVALGKTGTTDPGTLRERLVEDPHPPAREYAAEYLGSITGETDESVRVLAAVLARDPEAFVRARAATALGRIGTERAIEALERQGVPDRSDDVTRAARRALAVARGEDPEEVTEDPPSPGTGPARPDDSSGYGPGGSQPADRGGPSTGPPPGAPSDPKRGDRR
jgi:HEAT repeat protein